MSNQLHRFTQAENSTDNHFNNHYHKEQNKMPTISKLTLGLTLALSTLTASTLTASTLTASTLTVSTLTASTLLASTLIPSTAMAATNENANTIPSDENKTRYIVTFKQPHSWPHNNMPNGPSSYSAVIKSEGSVIRLDSEGSVIRLDSEGSVIRLAYPQYNTFALDMNQDTADVLQDRAEVLSVELDSSRTLLSVDLTGAAIDLTGAAADLENAQMTPYAVTQSQADQLSLQSDKKVCVIDSGLDNSNPDFDYNTITGSNNLGTGEWHTKGGSHGTHVAGIIAASDNNVGIKGIAAGVSMHIVKVFNANGWAYSSDLAAAIDDCTEHQADIISMSFGSEIPSRVEKIALDRFVKKGGLAVAAAGNSGNNTPLYPAAYRSVMMVGANDHHNNIADFSQHPACTTNSSGNASDRSSRGSNCIEVTAAGVNVFSTVPSLAALALTGSENEAAFSAQTTADGVNLKTLNIGNSGETSVSGLTHVLSAEQNTDDGIYGKICVIDRGPGSVSAQVSHCENNGGIAAVVINHQSGLFYGSLANNSSIAVVAAAIEDRAAWTSASFVSIDVVNSLYGFKSGTSMATPIVAGVAALVWSNHADCNGTEIRNALNATAADFGAAGKDKHFGHGMVQAKAASDHLTANGCKGQHRH